MHKFIIGLDKIFIKFCKTFFTLLLLDINECLITCNDSLTQTCIDTQGSYICQCKTGFVASGKDICKNINECIFNNGGCDLNATCTDTVGSFTCRCDVGFYGDGFLCEGIIFLRIFNFLVFSSTQYCYSNLSVS